MHVIQKNRVAQYGSLFGCIHFTMVIKPKLLNDEKYSLCSLKECIFGIFLKFKRDNESLSHLETVIWIQGKGLCEARKSKKGT